MSEIETSINKKNIEDEDDKQTSVSDADKQQDDHAIITELSVDNLIFGWDGNTLKVLLVKHNKGKAVGCWGLPGHWIYRDENLNDASRRVLKQFTTIDDIPLEQLQAFGDIDRYPGQRVVTIAYYGLVRPDQHDVAVGKDALEIEWFAVNHYPELILDHSKILEAGLKQLKHQIRRAPVGFKLLPEKFTLLELQKLYEGILNITLDKSNFRRKFVKLNLLIREEEKQTGVAHRAAYYYSFNKEAYDKLTKQGFNFTF